jgi:hypothetical protein
MQQVMSSGGVITWSVLHGGCNNVCRITWGVIWIFQNGGWKFCIRSSIHFFHNYNVFLGEKMFSPQFTFSSPISFRY